MSDPLQGGSASLSHINVSKVRSLSSQCFRMAIATATCTIQLLFDAHLTKFKNMVRSQSAQTDWD
ncbi:MAG: hypothetical protein DSM106950_42165 [Stigonema ocellatum SAG 48.90 = DSM 106950]|nr:hypothetical protein [Stigonema ocellatum SAG 48.90 = DSM 106950]